MQTDAELLKHIRALTEAGHYLVKNHAAQHMFAEGFSVSDAIAVLTGKLRMLERYPEQARCLVLGYYQMSATVCAPLHIVVEHSSLDEIEIITAYIPEKPVWVTPWQRASKKRGGRK